MPSLRSNYIGHYSKEVACQDMVATFVVIFIFRVLHFGQAQSNENCALTKAGTDELGMRKGYESYKRVIGKRVIGGQNSNYAPWQVAL